MALDCDAENRGKSYCDDTKTNREKGWLKPNGAPPTNPAFIDESEPMDIPPPAKPIESQEKIIMKSEIVDTVVEKKTPQKTVKKTTKKKTVSKSAKPQTAKEKALARRKHNENTAVKKAAREEKPEVKAAGGVEGKPQPATNTNEAPVPLKPIMPQVSDDLLTPAE